MKITLHNYEKIVKNLVFYENDGGLLLWSNTISLLYQLTSIGNVGQNKAIIELATWLVNFSIWHKSCTYYECNGELHTLSRYRGHMFWRN